MKKKIMAGALAVMLTLSTTVLAASTSQQITVNANQIKVVVDGKNITADNFLYNGTTYLPLRAVSEALGKEVAYDSATQTATITSTGTSASELTMDATTADVYYELMGDSNWVRSLSYSSVKYPANSTTAARESAIDDWADEAEEIRADVKKQEERIKKYQTKNAFYTTSFVEATTVITNFDKALDLFDTAAEKMKTYVSNKTDANEKSMIDTADQIDNLNDQIYTTCSTQHDKFMVRITE